MNESFPIRDMPINYIHCTGIYPYNTIRDLKSVSALFVFSTDLVKAYGETYQIFQLVKDIFEVIFVSCDKIGTQNPFRMQFRICAHKIIEQ
ncbi:CLUMA_CG012915, isoform A [Clunio marinus]|uniref:CLUMA_CG012915, isoform A n=1 Tax=Clunio marinus TaxID=568069 RepID=A0A1J1IHA6_9DIPT|nr:CLUMA_CG012915, isoform A [Clunio marinus]